MKKYVLITGASEGIGKSTAFKFALEGYNLILIARRKNLLEEIKKEIEAKYVGIEVVVLDKDLSIIANVFSVFEEVKKYDIELLVNNAGFGDINRIEDVSVQRNIEMVNLNIQALMILTLGYIKEYSKKGGTIINVSSVVGYNVATQSAIYSATKFFVSAFSEGIAHQLKEDKSNLRVKVLAPGLTKTDFARVALEGSKITDKKEFERWEDLPSKTSEEMAEYAFELFKSDKILGYADPQTQTLILSDGKYNIL